MLKDGHFVGTMIFVRENDHWHCQYWKLEFGKFTCEIVYLYRCNV